MRKTVKVQLVDDDRALEFEITQMAATQKQGCCAPLCFSLRVRERWI